MTVFKHKGRWCVEIATGDRTPSGHVRRRRRYVKTKAEAERLEREMLMARDTGYTLPRRDLTVATYLEDWLATVDQSDRKEATKINYRTITRRILIPQLGHHKLADLHQRHINAMVRHLLEDRSTSTARLARTTLSVALKQAMRADLLPRNVAELADPVRGVRRKPLRITLNDLPRLMEAAGDHYLAEAIPLIATTGLRRGEVCALTWGDLHLDENPAYLVVSKAITNLENGIGVTTTKTESSNRLLPLRDDIAHMLRARRQQRLNQVGHANIDNVYVFGFQRDGFTRPDTLTTAFRQFGNRAGIDGFGPHQLRHLFSTVVLATTDNIAAVSKTLGHANLRTTVDIYTHHSVGMLLQMKDVVDQAFPQTTAQPPGEQSA